MKPNRVGVISHKMLNFGPPDPIPEKFQDRKFYPHNPTVTLMHTTVEANRTLVTTGRAATMVGTGMLSTLSI